MIPPVSRGTWARCAPGAGIRRRAPCAPSEISALPAGRTRPWCGRPTGPCWSPDLGLGPCDPGGVGPPCRPLPPLCPLWGPEDFDRDRLAAFAAALPPGFSLSPILAGHYPLLTAQDWSGTCAAISGTVPTSPGVGWGHRSSGRGPRGRRLLLRRLGRRHRDPDRHPAGPAPPGLALSCGARLILTCLDQGLSPPWDAHDRRPPPWRRSWATA